MVVLGAGLGVMQGLEHLPGPMNSLGMTPNTGSALLQASVLAASHHVREIGVIARVMTCDAQRRCWTHSLGPFSSAAVSRDGLLQSGFPSFITRPCP